VTSDLPVYADDGDGAWLARRLVLGVLIVIALLGPTAHLLSHRLTPSGWFQLGAVIALGALTRLLIMTGRHGRRLPWPYLVAIVAVAIALFVAGGKSGEWIAALAIAAAACGRYTDRTWPAIGASVACSAAGLAVGILHNYGYGNTLSVVLIPPLAAFLSYSASRRADAMAALRRTRAELARAAAAEERLRIARDLHDLLGHSLSLITLKAELAGRVLAADPDRAAKELAELENVARQSLSDVREAVAGFRQPDLRGELAAARQLLDAAGIASQISSAGADSLPQEVDAALAWAVREGTTNVVRHSRATHVAIKVTGGPAAVVAEVSDNGPAALDEAGTPGQLAVAARDGKAGQDGLPAAGTPIRRGIPPGRLPGPPRAFAGSGLAGLAERVRELGGELSAGTVQPQGFLLRVVVPISQQAS
jgi:two-component system, NarL family, sensor histidine kinase DesK